MFGQCVLMRLFTLIIAVMQLSGPVVKVPLLLILPTGHLGVLAAFYQLLFERAARTNSVCRSASPSAVLQS